jgi:flagellar protein FliS
MNPYYERQILDADPIELVRLLHQHAINCVRKARQHLANRKIAERSQAIVQAYSVVAELSLSLRPEVAVEIGRNLMALYGFMQERLLEANLRQLDEPLAEVLGILTTLLEGWDGVATALMRQEQARAAQADAHRRSGMAVATSVAF